MRFIGSEPPWVFATISISRLDVLNGQLDAIFGWLKNFQLGVGVGRDEGDAVVVADAEHLQRCGPAVAALEEFAVCPAARAVDNFANALAVRNRDVCAGR